MWRCGGSILHPHSSTLHPHKFYIPPHNIHITSIFSNLKCGKSTLHPYSINVEMWIVHITSTFSIRKCGIFHNFKVEMQLNNPSLTLTKSLIHNIQIQCLDPMAIFRKRSTFSFRFSENGNLLSVSFSRKNLPDYFPWTQNVAVMFMNNKINQTCISRSKI